MNKVVAFLNANPVQYLATVGRDGKAKCRPFMFAGELEGKLWFCTNNQKDVYKDMPIAPINVDLSAYDHMTICTPIWVFSVAATMRSFCAQASGKIEEADYILVQHQNSTYESAANEMDQLLALKRTGFRSVRCRKGTFNVVHNDTHGEK